MSSSKDIQTEEETNQPQENVKASIFLPVFKKI